jgi:hypothetical protein
MSVCNELQVTTSRTKKKQVLDAKDEITHFVTGYRPRSEDAVAIDTMKGSFSF